MTVDVIGQITGKGVYWSIPPPEEKPDKLTDELAEEARSLLQQSVARHIVSDVPIGAFLSSGLDSTTVVSLMHRIAPDRSRSFTVVFDDEPEYNEGPLARNTAQRLGIEHHECRVTGETALEWAKKGLQAMDQPSMDGLNTYIISRAVKEQGIVVALSGQGGDEIFGGYPSFRDVPALIRKLSWLRFMPGVLREALVRVAFTGRGVSFREKAKDMARSGADLLDLYFHRRRLCSDGQMRALGLNSDVLCLTSNFQSRNLEVADCIVEDDVVASVSRLESRFYLGNMLLRDGDVFGMANSLEIRVPLLDRDLVEWVYRLPGEILLPPGSPSKPLLRQACAEFFIGKIGVQSKRGFTLPLAKWMQGPLEEMVKESLEYMKNSGLVRQQGLYALCDDFQREPLSPIWSRIWAITTLGHWFKMNLQKDQ
jgi:asparagine synthase (glutamine-hydrolysing)